MRASAQRQGARRQGALRRRLVFSFVALSMVVLSGSGWVLYRQALRSLERQLGAHLVAEAQLIAGVLERGSVAALRPGWEDSDLYRRLHAQLRQTQLTLGARRIYVFDRNGRALLDTEESKRIGREAHELKIHKPQVERLWAGEAAHTRRITDGASGIHYMTGYAPIYSHSPRGDSIVAGVGVDIGAGYMDSIVGFKRSVYLLAALGALLTLIVGVAMARHITRPVQRLVTAAREIGRGNLERAVSVDATDEIGYLGETMEEMRRKLLAREAQLRQMLAGVAHEIRNPLSGIEIYAGLIADELPDGDLRKQHIQKVIAEVRTLNHVIAEFLDFARPASPQKEDVDLAQLVGDVAFLLSPEMEAAGVSYDSQVPPDTRVHADPEQIKRAVINLMKNGVQAMDEGGTLTLRVARNGDQVALEVEDTGRGVTDDVRRRLFEPFFTTRQTGSGLGLAIVQQAAERNAGRVEVDSVPGIGSTFRLVLPAAGSAVPVEVAP